MRSIPIRTILRAAAVAFLVVACSATFNAAPETGRTGGVIDLVGIELGNPFVARRVSRSIFKSMAGADRINEIEDDVARDSQGRIRFEQVQRMDAWTKSQPVTLATRTGESFVSTYGELSRRILIYDDMDLSFVTLEPGKRIAVVRPWGMKPPLVPGTRLYSSFVLPREDRIMPVDTRFEDLGVQEIEGFLAHGYRSTFSETVHADGRRTSASMHEYWISEDLGVTLLDIHASSDRGEERRVSLTKISREEPDPSLFQIPSNFKVNPSPAEEPCIVSAKR